ncbi:MAG: hypothetical protein FXF49_00370 [Flexistipes sinusarabici]|uniref:Uncharacterized protein n=1 Tax=Flexistipes sinusarabici TaxID=2352 RepID=A0A5D0MY58_FLESI|nr:hypothetical protein [Flexistipes sinusarabici]TYB36971.1 MAG: hypothetical protein FXF49_00370 [Flexistipes sinusarabici]
MNIEELIRIHDRSQFEIKLGYLINHKKKKTEYDINLYFFLPNNLGINRYNYSNSQFFEDLYGYVRLITPKSSLQNLTERMKNIINFMNLKKQNIDNHFGYINYEIKITICSYRAYLRDFAKKVKKNHYSNEDINNLIKEIQVFRQEIMKLPAFTENTNRQTLNDLLAFTDEYSSLLTVMYMFRIYDFLSKNKSEINAQILNMINDEIEYRKLRGMSYASEDDSKNEELIYKYSVFKKYFYNILFLFQKRREDAVEFRHFLYAIAAGIAMIFATTVAFLSQKKYGNFTLSFFVALVISYMFKDRIKDLFRQIFENKLFFRKVFDFRNKIYDPERYNLFGFYKERVRFISKNQIPEKILQTRLQKADSSLSTWYTGEDIMKYEKKITLNNRKIIKSFNDKIEGLNDIVRFNVNHFIRKMDDPSVTLHTLENGMKKITASKVYHVNLVIEFKSEEEYYSYKVRLILTKDGIKRVEIPEYDIILTNS